MSTKIRIKRSGITPAPNALAAGEMAYSWEGTTGGKLYIGWGDETDGIAENRAIIGGKYYTGLVTDRISHTPGTLVANSAIIVDSNSKINILNVDNITIDNNTISVDVTDTNGSIFLAPNGTGTIDVSSSRITSVATPTANTDATNKEYVDTEIAALNNASNLDFEGDSGNGSITFSTETFTISGTDGLSTSATDNTLTIKINTTGVTANTYGSSTAIPVLAINEQGQITSATTADIATTLKIGADVGTDDTVDLINDTFTISGNTGLTTTVFDNEIVINLDDTLVTPGSYGSASSVATFEVDQQGRLTTANTITIDILSSQVSDFTEAVQDVVGAFTSANTTQGIVVNYTNVAGTGDTLVISASDASDTQKGVASFANTNFTVSSGAVTAKDITLGSTTLSLGSTITTLAGLTQLDVDNIRIDLNTISSTSGAINIEPIVDGDVNITTTGTGDITLNVPSTREITVSTLAVTDLTTSTGLVIAGAAGELETSADLTFDGTTLYLNGVLNVDNAISIDGNTISSSVANSDIILAPNGTGTVNVSTARITNVGTPEDGTDAATKTYVDTIASAAIHYHDPVRVESPDPLPGGLSVTYDNGTAGVGATLTGTNTVLVIDGITVDLNDRVLVYKQADLKHNGVYYVSQVGVAGTTPWILTRSLDTDSYLPSNSTALGQGDSFFVKEGNTGAGELYVMTSSGEIIFGTTEINFSQISSAQIYKAGDGLLLSGITFSAKVDDSTIGINSSTKALEVKIDGITNDLIANNTIANSKLVNSTITIAAQVGTADPVSLGETITFAASTGIKTEITSNNTITFSGVDASDTVKGIASFANTDFIVSSGSVTLNTDRVQDIIFDAISATANTGIDVDYNPSENTFTIAGIDASITVKGVAKFGGYTATVFDTINNVDTGVEDTNSDRQFSVSSGNVRVVALDGGTF